MQPTRRSVLAAGVLGLGAACTSTRHPTPAAVDPDLALADAARTREQALIDAYAAVAVASPHLSVELSALSSHHVEHLTALSTAVASPTPTVATQLQRRDTSPAARAARARLAALERATAKEHGAAAVTASRRLAPLLASLAACEASHAEVLRVL